MEGENGAIQILDEQALTGPRGPAPGPIAGFILADDHLARGLSLSGSLFIKVPMFLCSDASAACAADGAMPQALERGQHGDDDERHDARGAPARQAQAGDR